MRAEKYMMSISSQSARVISRRLMSLHSASRSLMKYRLSCRRLASSTSGMPLSLHMAEICRAFSSEKGCPPMRFVPASRRTKAMFSTPFSAMSFFSLSGSMLPLNGKSLVGLRPSSMSSSSTTPPHLVMWAFVVVKW